ncbi:MAG: hypothetical protein PHV11_02835 [Candidatus Bipolaricaulis sp.]|nr:hypothetical protein [Candidatus Bipolaricaulis sp.]
MSLSRGLGRWRHIVRLVPLGLAVGGIVGALFRDPWYGLAVGAGFGVVFGLLFAWHAPHE